MMSGGAASALVGLTVAGPIVDATSLPLWFILAGIISIAVGASGFLIPDILKIEQKSLNVRTRAAEVEC
jgi:ABC-type uncharacterized transport system permease subunit